MSENNDGDWYPFSLIIGFIAVAGIAVGLVLKLMDVVGGDIPNVLYCCPAGIISAALLGALYISFRRIRP